MSSVLAVTFCVIALVGVAVVVFFAVGIALYVKNGFDDVSRKMLENMSASIACIDAAISVVADIRKEYLQEDSCSCDDTTEEGKVDAVQLLCELGETTLQKTSLVYDPTAKEEEQWRLFCGNLRFLSSDPYAVFKTVIAHVNAPSTEAVCTTSHTVE